jgi:hypothetical protein
VAAVSADPLAFVCMSDAQVIEVATAHYRRAATLPSGSQHRAIEWAKFTDAYDEYARREDERVQRMLARHLRADPPAPANSFAPVIGAGGR